MLSHWLLQQYGSCAQIFVAHGSQLDVSFEPLLQIACAQPPGGGGGGGGALHDWPQIELTSPTQMLSHWLLQQ
jgi:hypothetical protein